LAVKKEDIQAVAKKYLRAENRAIVFRTPVKSSENTAGEKEAA
jgi:predicted Zn-dependent peptidase